MAEPADACEDLQLVVEAGRRRILDVLSPHHEVGRARRRREEVEMAQVLDPGTVEVGHVATVVDDPLGIRLVESNAGAIGKAERRPPVGDRHLSP